MNSFEMNSFDWDLLCLAISGGLGSPVISGDTLYATVVVCIIPKVEYISLTIKV